MPNSIPSPSGDVRVPFDPNAGDFLHFHAQPAGLMPDRRCSVPVALVTLARTTAILTARSGDSLERLPVRDESVWVLPAGSTYSANWHQPVPLLQVRLPERTRIATPRLIRLVDFTRMDWDLSAAIDSFRAQVSRRNFVLDESGEEQGRVLARRLSAALCGPEAYCRTAGLSDERFESVTDFIEDNITEKLSREFLAKTDGLSLHHFARMFKARTGLTPREYVTRRRCFLARRLIASGTRLAEAAAAVGFTDQPDMCKKFAVVFGCPPSSFAPSPN